MLCSKGRRVGGRYRPSVGAPTNAGQNSGKLRRQHVRNRLYPGLLRNGRQKRSGIPSAGNRFRNAGVWNHSDKGTILDNISSVGDHVCSWIHTTRGYTLRTKIYNKAVSQFEAGEVNETSSRQWKNLAKHLNRCFLLADRTQETLWMGWGGHTKTGRLQGVVAKPSTKTLEKEGAWERAILCMMADFGYRNCPIFQVEILGVEHNEVAFLEVRCFQKYAPTILAARRRPFQLHPGAPDPQTPLPTTEHVEWTWRKEKAHAIGTRYPSCPLWEIPEIAANREMATLSTRNRAVRLKQILDERTKLEWGEKLEEIARTKEGARKLRSQEIEQMREVVETKERLLIERAKIRNTVKGALSEPTTKKLREVSGKR